MGEVVGLIRLFSRRCIMVAPPVLRYCRSELPATSASVSTFLAKSSAQHQHQHDDVGDLGCGAWCRPPPPAVSASVRVCGAMWGVVWSPVAPCLLPVLRIRASARGCGACEVRPRAAAFARAGPMYALCLSAAMWCGAACMCAYGGASRDIAGG